MTYPRNPLVLERTFDPPRVFSAPTPRFPSRVAVEHRPAARREESYAAGAVADDDDAFSAGMAFAAAADAVSSIVDAVSSSFDAGGGDFGGGGDSGSWD